MSNLIMERDVQNIMKHLNVDEATAKEIYQEMLDDSSIDWSEISDRGLMKVAKSTWHLMKFNKWAATLGREVTMDDFDTYDKLVAEGKVC